MAVTKAQLVVWALIGGLSVGGYAALSRITLPDDTFAGELVARAAPALPQVVVPRSAGPAATVAEALPAEIPQFPFPDDLVTATVGGQSTGATQVAAFAEIPGGAVPEISTIAGDAATIADVNLPAASPMPGTITSPVGASADFAATEEPPVPMPARPVVAQPAKAVPLSEVKTLYVVADALNVRALPSTNGTVLQKLPQGFAVAAREQSSDWIGFVMRDGSTGWMRTDYLSDTMPPPAQASASPVRVWTEPLNLMM